MSPMIPVRRPHLPWRIIEGRTVIVNPAQGQVHELNSVATVIWEKMDGRRSLEEIAAHLTDEFEVTAEQSDRDIQTLSQTLVDLQLIDFVSTNENK